jgi:hypothetical protein
VRVLTFDTVPAELLATQITKFWTEAEPDRVIEPSGFWMIERPSARSNGASQSTPMQTSTQSVLQSPQTDWTPSSTVPSQLSSS